MRNLAPTCQSDLHTAGILSAQDLVDLGLEVKWTGSRQVGFPAELYGVTGLDNANAPGKS